MENELIYVFLFIGICLVLYVLFRNFKYTNQYSLIEGMTDASENEVTSSGNGIAGNAASYGAQIKVDTIKLEEVYIKDILRDDWEICEEKTKLPTFEEAIAEERKNLRFTLRPPKCR